MDLSLNDAATLLGKSPRQVRYLIRQEKLGARKVGGQWVIASADLPLTDAQRQAAAARAADVREAVDAALGPGLAAAEGAAGAGDARSAKRRYSLRDLRAYQKGEPLYRETAARFGPEDPASVRLRRALEHLAQGCHCYLPQEKTAAYGEARREAAAAVVELMIGGAAGEPIRAALADRVEQELLPDVSGLIRGAERKARRGRFDSHGFGRYGGRP